jgi:NADH-quinone oxidoreductase subunit N
MEIEFPNLNFAAIMPIIIIFAGAFVVMFLELFIRDKRVLGYLSLVGLLAAAISSYSLFFRTAIPSYQSMFVGDGYALVLNFVFIVAAMLSILVAISYLGDRGLQRGEYYALLLFSTGGMMLMAGATDMVTIFMGLEVMSIALYILAAFNRQRMGSGEAGMKYFILGAFASAFFLYGVALLYGVTGSTNLNEMRLWFNSLNQAAASPLALVGLGLLLVGFAFKVAAVPFQWWTPDVYHGAPTSVTAFMSVGAKAAGFAAMMRVLMVTFGGDSFIVDWQLAISLLAVITMTVGNVAALAQQDVKRMLAYSSIAHAGYILVGVATGTMAGVRAVIFYLLAYTIINIGAFAVVSVIERRSTVGSRLSDYAGLAARKPLLALAMLFFMFSLTGIPPFVGFWGKLYVFWAAVDANLTWLAIVGVINSAISAFYYLGVVVQMYMRSVPEDSEQTLSPIRLSLPVTVALGIAALLAIVFGLWPSPLVDFTALAFFG